MIAKPHRFHGYGSLRGVYGHGQTVRGPLLSLKFTFRGSRHAYRAAVVVSRKVNKSAVVRNRIRRRVYEVVRGQEKRLPAGLDLIFTVFSDELVSLDQSKLERTVTGLLQKAIQATGLSARSTGSGRDIVKPERG